MSNLFHIIRYAMSIVVAKFCNSKFMDSSRTSALKRSTPDKNYYFINSFAITWKRCKTGCNLVLIINKRSHRIFIGSKIGDLEWS